MKKKRFTQLSRSLVLIVIALFFAIASVSRAQQPEVQKSVQIPSQQLPPPPTSSPKSKQSQTQPKKAPGMTPAQIPSGQQGKQPPQKASIKPPAKIKKSPSDIIKQGPILTPHPSEQIPAPQNQPGTEYPQGTVNQPGAGYQPGATASYPKDQNPCYSFNPATATITEFKDGWAVMDSTNPNRAIVYAKKERRGDVDFALQVIQKYGMNSVCYGKGSFTYYLVSGQSPQGNIPGEECKAFNPMTITVEQKTIVSKQDPSQILGTYWAIMDGQKQIWGFGNDETAAREALSIIQNYGFSNVCYMGFYYLHK